MSTCARCNDSLCCANSTIGWQGDGDAEEAVIERRDRQIAAQVALLRSVTAKLEEASDLLEPPGDARAAAVARELVVGVLEVLA